MCTLIAMWRASPVAPLVVAQCRDELVARGALDVARFDAGGSLQFDLEHRERAFLVVEGEVESGGDLHGTETHRAGSMMMCYPEEEVTLFAHAPARIMLLGGAPLDGPRHIWWNFVSSSRERIERAKEEWKSGAFGTIPGDDKEFIPLPEEKK